MIRRRTNQSGFTTVELAFAGLIAAGLTLVGLNLLITSMDMKADLDGACTRTAPPGLQW